ncbi:unnamed protein product [Rotaria socialis]|uniref:Uncharacterized protein n=2 Tax=Rotaria socialis TaxID=392032 RepID=A0A819WVM3_9BILA|nr:unnamed protein product [Rotaria socialis]CAF3410065.1 unnamed protein product [Rotaria socialis]CAF3428530.1 unnamed protein product [Rotaria socialis]CAF3451504.1 unnamed protein product [Rotaria socialis]CAF4127778.1 unnamed protein product [Rotaria socialis]
MDKLDDKQRALIPHSLRELTLHCIYKGLQLGPTVTIVTVLPYKFYKSRKNLSFMSILSRAGTLTIYGSFIGVSLSLAMMHMKLYKENYNEYKIWDRAYRLRYSESQKRADKYSLTFSIFGGLTAFYIGLPKKFSSLSATKGALMAIPFGLLTHVITQYASNRSNKKN